MDFPSEYLDDAFSKEHANQKKRRSTAKSKIHPPAKLGKYSLSSQDVKETEPLSDDEADDGDTCELIEILAEYQDLLPEILPGAAYKVEYDDENDESTQNRTYVRYTAEAGRDDAAAAGSLSYTVDGEQEASYADEAGRDSKDGSVADDDDAAAGSETEDGEQEASYADEAEGDPTDGSVIDNDDAGGLSGVIIDQLITEDRGKCCCQIFGVDSSSSETAVKEALIRKNEADLKRKHRHRDPAAKPSTSATSHQSKTNPPKSSPTRASKESSQTSSSSSITNAKTPPSKGRVTPSSTLASSSSIPLSASPVSNVPSRINSTTASTFKKTSKTPLMVRSDAVKPNTTAAKQKLKNKERLVPTNNSSNVAGSSLIPPALPETINLELSSSPASSIKGMFGKVKSSTPSKASSSNNSRSGTGTF